MSCSLNWCYDIMMNQVSIDLFLSISCTPIWRARKVISKCRLTHNMTKPRLAMSKDLQRSSFYSVVSICINTVNTNLVASTSWLLCIFKNIKIKYRLRYMSQFLLHYLFGVNFRRFSTVSFSACVLDFNDRLVGSAVNEFVTVILTGLHPLILLISSTLKRISYPIYIFIACRPKIISSYFKLGIF